MTDILDLNQYKKDRTPKRTGHAQCTHCNHRWIAHDIVEGTAAFDCPACGLEKGVFAAHCLGSSDDEYLQCDCGSFYFHHMRSPHHGQYDMCVNCGQRFARD